MKPGEEHLISVLEMVLIGKVLFLRLHAMNGFCLIRSVATYPVPAESVNTGP